MQSTKRLAAALALLIPLTMTLFGNAAGSPGGTATCSDLLVNGGFEAGPVGWTQSSSGGFDLINQFNPRSGAWGAYLAGYNEADDQLQQTLTLPAGAATATLRAWWMLETEEPVLPNDSLTISLLRLDGTTLADLWRIDNTEAAGLWDEAVIDLTGYAGQQVVLQLHATTNQFDLTDFYVDDMSLQVCVSANGTLRSYLPLVVHG